MRVNIKNNGRGGSKVSRVSRRASPLFSDVKMEVRSDFPT